MASDPTATPFRTLWMLSLIDMLAVGLTLPLMPIILLNTNLNLLPGHWLWHLKLIFSGLLIASYPLAQFISTPVVGSLSDRLGRKPMIMVAALGTSVGWILFAMGIAFSQVWMLFAGRIIDGLCGGVQTSIRFATADIATHEGKLTKFSLLYVAFGLGIIIGPIGGGLISEMFNSATLVFWFAGIISAFNLVLITLLFLETHMPSKKKTDILAHFTNLLTPFRNKRVRAIFTTFFVFSLGWACFYQFFQIFLNQRFEFEPLAIGLMLGYAGICVIIVQGLIVPLLAKKFKTRTLLSFALFLSALALLLIYLAPTKESLYLFVPLLAFGVGTAQPCFSTLVSNAGSRSDQGELIGVQQSLISFTFGTTALVSAFALAVSASTPVFLASMTVLASGIIFLLAPKEKTS